MSADDNAGPVIYAPPHLQILGSVHELTKGGFGPSVHVLLKGNLNGSIVIGSS